MPLDIDVAAIPSPSDLRARIARDQVLLYELAARVGYHPARLGQMLNEKIPMPPATALRIREVLLNW